MNRHADRGRAAARSQKARRGTTSGARRSSKRVLGLERAEHGGRDHHEQMRALGCVAAIGIANASRWTESLSRAVREVFVRLYEEGLIYRGDAPGQLVTRGAADGVLRPRGRDDEERQGSFGTCAIPASTAAEERHRSRDDAARDDAGRHRSGRSPGRTVRYKHLMRQTHEAPSPRAQIPIIGDDAVDPAFGTGALRVTPGHGPDGLRDRSASLAPGDRHLRP